MDTTTERTPEEVGRTIVEMLHIGSHAVSLINRSEGGTTQMYNDCEAALALLKSLADSFEMQLPLVPPIVHPANKIQWETEPLLRPNPIDQYRHDRRKIRADVADYHKRDPDMIPL